MFNKASLRKTTFLFSASLLVLSFPQVAFADGELNPIDIEGEVTSVDDSTVVYGQEFIALQSGMATVIDLINRIPGGSNFLNNNNDNQRGFSNNDDPILINGQRISGKSNSSVDALSRIAVDQVLRIEVIRGSSPDIKVSSQGALLNVVLHQNAGGSGSWSLRGHQISGKTSGRADVSYNDKMGNIDYSISAFADEFRNDVRQNEQLFDAVDVPLLDKQQILGRSRKNFEVSTNMSVNLNSGDAININALYGIEDFKEAAFGDQLVSDGAGGLVAVGENVSSKASDEKYWEVGMDFDTHISDNWELKLVGLHSQRTDINNDNEDFEVTDGVVLNDFDTFRDIFRSENVARAAFVWSPSSEHRLELGSELAFNKRTTDFTLFTLQDGVLVKDNVASTLVTIKEVRDESFAIHSWQINDKLSLDSAVTYEYSRITQSGNLDKERSFNFWKPSWDLRYNLTDNDQFQFSIRKEVSQLDFARFASTLNDDNQIIGGNENLSPERSWVYEASYEHRLADDMGFIKPSVKHTKFANKLSRILVSEGISGVGNAGPGTETKYGIEGALRLFFIGLPEVQVSGDFNYRVTNIEDFFTGDDVPFNGRRTAPVGTLKIRHDVPKYGFLWEVQGELMSGFEFRDLNVFADFTNKNAVALEVAVEKEVLDGIILRVSYDNILDTEYIRQRLYYAGGRAGGALTSREERVRQFNRQLYITLKGTF